MSIIGFVAVFVVLKFIITWITIMSVVTLISPDTAWKMHVLWGRLRGTLDTIPDQPQAWGKRVRIGSIITLPICLTLLAFFVQALLPVLN